LFFGLSIVLVLAWAFDLTTEGIERTVDNSPEAQVTKMY
jgi:hypothetical protein